MDILDAVKMVSCCNHSPPERVHCCGICFRLCASQCCDNNPLSLRNRVGQKTGQRRDKTESQVAGNLTCERPGEGAGWGLEGDPVIGCGALFISWGSACGGGCGSVYKSEKREREVKCLCLYKKQTNRQLHSVPQWCGPLDSVIQWCQSTPTHLGPPSSSHGFSGLGRNLQ